MRGIQDIIEVVKDIISIDYRGKKVYDKNVAYSLGVSQDQLACLKKRGKIPYKEICAFAEKKGLDLNYLLLESGDSFRLAS